MPGCKRSGPEEGAGENVGLRAARRAKRRREHMIGTGRSGGEDIPSGPFPALVMGPQSVGIVFKELQVQCAHTLAQRQTYRKAHTQIRGCEWLTCLIGKRMALRQILHGHAINQLSKDHCIIHVSNHPLGDPRSQRSAGGISGHSRL